MHRAMSISACLGVAGVIVLLAASNAWSNSAQGTGLVRLQAVTPGTAQTGHANLSGTIRASQFVGGGAGLTNLAASQLTGTIADARLGVGGDLQGPLSASVVMALRGNPIGPGVPVSGEFLKWNGTNWSSSSNGGSLTNVNATQLDGFDSTAFLQSVPVPLQLSGAAAAQVLKVDNLAVLGSNYAGRFEVASTSGVGVLGITTAGSGSTVGVEGRTLSTSGVGVFGAALVNTGTNYGGYFESVSSSGRGVYGLALSNTGSSYGGYFTAASTSGTGLFASSTATSGDATGLDARSASTTGTAIFARATAATGLSYAINALNDSSTGTGIFARGNTAIHGKSNDSGGTGIFGEVTMEDGFAVTGIARSPYGVTHGGYFESSSFDGVGAAVRQLSTGGYTTGLFVENASNIGVGIRSVCTGSGITYGVSATTQSSHGNAVEGIDTNPDGNATGVYGQSGSSAGFGVKGFATSTDGNFHYGVYGVSAGTAAAIFAAGDLAASGTKSFRIDHPFDPLNKYLVHFCEEAPKPYNFYKGRVKTNAKGYARVQLPDYFQAINKDWDYQLTVVDSSDDFVLAKVAREIENNSFEIRTSQPNVTVCWRVEAERNDDYVQSRQISDVIAKEGPEKGKYQHPELHGAPPEMGIDYLPPRKSRKR